MVRLFVERAGAVQPDFAPAGDEVLPVAELCRRLDGLPLAIELAAARVERFPPSALLARLEPYLAAAPEPPAPAPPTRPVDGARSLPVETQTQRDATLRGAIAWAYDLLDAAEQTLLCRLAVFAGGGTSRAAAAVCGAADDLAIDLSAVLRSLVAAGLLRREESDGDSRFAMLEPILAYGQERLAAGGEAEALQRRHAAYFMALAEQARPEIEGPDPGPWLERLRRERDNLRAALRWCVEHGQIEWSVRLARALGVYWTTQGRWAEARDWLAKTLTLAEAPPQT
ncbi:MAG: ATP-binding protein [Chloroflexota bacterium]